jgi:hypothetical protein
MANIDITSTELVWPGPEACFEDGQPSLGMGDDEVRSWRGWPLARSGNRGGTLPLT